MLLGVVDQVASPSQPNTLSPEFDLVRVEHESGESHQEFRNSLKGQEAIIPNLYTLFPEWKPKLHKDHERARNDVLNPWLARWVDDPRTLAKLQRAQFTIFAAIVCSDDVPFEKLCTMAKYFAWYFVWDDQFDCGSFAHDVEGLAIYKRKSREFFEFALLQTGEYPDLSMFSQAQRNALICWDEVGTHIRKICTRGTCEVLLQKTLNYIASVDTVDVIFHAERIPSLVEYWRRRDLTAAVYPVMATLPFIYELDITERSFQNRDLVNLWKHTSYIVHITNDMLSLRKEIRENQIENLIPILMMNSGSDSKVAMLSSFQFAQVEADAICAIETRIRTKKMADIDETSRLMSNYLIDGCKDVAMGLIHWSYLGERYFNNGEISSDLTIHFQL